MHYDCTNRNSFGYCKTQVCIHANYSRDWIESTAEKSQTVVIKPLTNADRIRGMPDEEMAEWRWNRDIAIVEKASKAAGFTFTVNREKCVENILDWLRQEAEEGET